MNVELMAKQLAKHLSGIPDKKALKILRNERNVLGCYRVIGNYHKVQQKNELGVDSDASSEGV